jgi:hypothetical protein
MLKNVFKNKKRGVSLVEVVIAASIITVFVVVLMGAYSIYLKFSLANLNNVKAIFLIEEGLEAGRFIAHSGWQDNIETLDFGQDYYLEFSGSVWSLSETPVLIDGTFDRRIVFEDVFRGADGRIADSGTLDSGTKKATVFVSWNSGSSQTTRSISTYITDIHNN